MAEKKQDKKSLTKESPGIILEISTKGKVKKMLSVRDKLKLDFVYLTIKRLDRLKREEHEKTGRELDVLIREYLLKGRVSK